MFLQALNKWKLKEFLVANTKFVIPLSSFWILKLSFYQDQNILPILSIFYSFTNT